VKTNGSARYWWWRSLGTPLSLKSHATWNDAGPRFTQSYFRWATAGGRLHPGRPGVLHGVRPQAPGPLFRSREGGWLCI